MKSMLSKLRSRAGESIGETLVALLISALALVMLAGAVSSAAGIVKQSNEAMGRYYAETGGEDTAWREAVKVIQ